MKKLFFISLLLYQTAYSMIVNLNQMFTPRQLSELENLLRSGGDLNVPSQDGMTPLHRAATMQDSRVAQLLLAHGANPNVHNREGWTPLHYASRYNRSAIITLLAQHRADLHARTSATAQETALHIASSLQHLQATQALLQAGANPRTTNIHNQTPLHELCIARRQGNPSKCVALALAELLISHAIQRGCYRDDYIFALDNTGKKAIDYLEDTEQDLARALRSQQEIDREKLQLMLKRHNMSLIQYLRNRELGLLAPR